MRRKSIHQVCIHYQFRGDERRTILIAEPIKGENTCGGAGCDKNGPVSLPGKWGDVLSIGRRTALF